MRGIFKNFGKKLINFFKFRIKKFCVKIFDPIVKLIGRIYQNVLDIKIYTLTLYILISWTAGIGGKDELKSAHLKKKEIFLFGKKKIEKDIYFHILNYHKMKKLEIIVSVITFFLLVFYFLYSFNLTPDLYSVFDKISFIKQKLIHMYSYLAKVQYTIKLIFFLSFLIILAVIFPLLNSLYLYIKKFIVFIYKYSINLFLQISKSKLYEYFINKSLGKEKSFIETLFLSIGILPSDLPYYILIQRTIYFINILRFFFIVFILILEIFFKNTNLSEIFRDFIFLFLGFLLTYLPFYFSIYNFLEKYLLPRVHIVFIGKKSKEKIDRKEELAEDIVIEDRKRFEELKSNFYLDKNFPNLSVRNYYFYIFIPLIIKEDLNRHGYKLFEIIENLLRRTSQYFLASQYQSILFHVGNSIVYFYMLIFFFLSFVFLYTLKDILETSFKGLDVFSKEMISIILIILLISWSIFFLRLTIYLFPHHLWSYLSDKIKQTKILDNIHIMSFTINRGIEEINPYDIVNTDFKVDERLNLIFSLTSSVIITIILSVLLSQIE